MEKRKLISKIFGIALALVVVYTMLGCPSALVDKVEASTVTIYVPDDYLTIQAAVNASSSGDTIIVRDGTYIENVDVDTDHLTVQSENGAEATIIQAADPDMNIFYIRGSYVSISGFTVQGATGGIPSGERSSGIHVCGADYCNVFGNIACNNGIGIAAGYSARNNIIASNNATNNTVGIEICSAYDNIINDCVTSNNRWGIVIQLCNLPSNDMLARDNNLGNGEIAVPLPSSNSAVRSYVLSNSGEIASNNTVINTEASNNDYGIYLGSLNDNIIYLSNFIDNSINVYSNNSTNIWNSPEEITYTYDGSIYMNHLGNYWSDYFGGDVDGDGIGEVPYPIYSDADNYPLVEPFENYIILEIEEIQLFLQPGWNMVSIPVAPADNLTSTVFPEVAGIFTWNATSKSYYEPTVIDPEKGYWVAVTENTTVAINGTPIETWTTDIKAGWNMIGSVSINASIADPNDEPDGSVIPPAYWWDPVDRKYIEATDIEPGKGYWLASINDCTLTL